MEAAHQDYLSDDQRRREQLEKNRRRQRELEQELVRLKEMEKRMERDGETGKDLQEKAEKVRSGEGGGGCAGERKVWPFKLCTYMYTCNFSSPSPSLPPSLPPGFGGCLKGS